jgi:hypothetical protein
MPVILGRFSAECANVVAIASSAQQMTLLILAPNDPQILGLLQNNFAA